MNLLKYFILILILWNIPSVALSTVNPVISNILSVLSFLSLVIYYILVRKTNINSWMIILGLAYFSISSLSGQENIQMENKYYFAFIIKYFILVICGNELMKRVSKKELIIFLIIGAISIVFQILFFYNPLKDSGRYSGFYLNPNTMAFICLIGYGLTFAFKDRKMRLVGQVVFTVFGLFTFSRTFIIIWLLMNIISLKISFKNIRVFLIGFGALLILISYNEFLPVKSKRIEMLSVILGGSSIESSGIDEDSRTETWSHFYDDIYQKPFFGHGFGAFSGHSTIFKSGTHNTYLKIIGEAGFFTLLIFITMYILMLKDSFRIFKLSPHLFLLSISMILFLATFHNYFETGFVLLISMWIQAEIKKEMDNRGKNIVEL